MATKKTTPAPAHAAPKKKSSAADALAANASEEVKVQVNDAGFVAAKKAEYATDDYCILNGISEQGIADIAYIAIHAADEELKAHCTRLVTNYPLYNPQ